MAEMVVSYRFSVKYGEAFARLAAMAAAAAMAEGRFGGDRYGLIICEKCGTGFCVCTFLIG
ncbi:MAG: hypothetical protein K8L97_25505 [Anaerolineae bacterium]|nr:hypothetical protein [Anaerolineae bacterium]